jgi:DNA repair exonuclease SbcCD ATPase subunit
MRFEEVAVANFRGFCEERRIEMPANVVIIRGPNGSGKTSFLDAIQWLLLGDVERLKAGALKPSEDYLSNRYASGPPFVEARLLDGEDRAVRVSRRGLGKAMQVQVDVDGDPPRIEEDAEEWLGAVMSSGRRGQGKVDFLRRYLLQQDDMREFLGADTKERYKFIAALSGMERLTSLEAQMREELNAARQRVRVLKDEIDKSKVALEAVSSSVLEARELVAGREDPGAGEEVKAQARELLGEEATSEPLAALRERAATIGEAIERIGELHRREERVRAEVSDGGPGESEKAAALEAELVAAKEAEERTGGALKELEAGLEGARAAADHAQQLAALALEQIDEGPCPVCGQEHDLDNTRAHLQQLLAGAPGLGDLGETVERQRQEYQRAREKVAALDSSLAGLREALEGRRQAQDLLDEVREEAARASAELLAQLPEASRSKGKGDPLGSAGGLREQLEQLASRLQRVSDAKTRARSARQRAVSLEQQRSSAQERHEELSEQLASAQQRAKLAAATRSSLGHKITEVMQEVSNTSTGLINAIYAYLDIHPTFREFGFHSDRYNEVGHLRPWVYDRRRQKDGNALHVLSAAQLNSLAICLFLALNLERDAGLRTAILDDPVQSLDDVNLLSLADVLRTVRGRRQVIVSTHDEVLAELLARKLRPLGEKDATAQVTIEDWGEAGPNVRTDMRGASDLEPEFQLLDSAV